MSERRGVPERLGILVGGGPAPGINSVIAAATIEAINNGLQVIGIYDGYRHIVAGDISHVTELTIADVVHVHSTGGSILRTSRTNPAKDPAGLTRAVESLKRLGLRYLVTIGGDDTTYGAIRIAEASEGKIGVASVPKTIDNDLPLPGDAPTFGFETARSVGTAIVENLMEDARTASRWYLAVTMGRKSGSLALGIARASGATLAVIAEEFGEQVDMPAVVDTIVGAIIKRRAAGADHGVAVVAEGFVERLSPEALSAFSAASTDAYGHVRLADIPIGFALRDAVTNRLKELGLDITVVPKDIGYELRCAKPVPFDLEYTRTLGYGAIKFLLSGGSGALVALSGGRVVPVTLDELRDEKTGRVRVRLVDTTTESYQVALKYMIRLQPEDLQEPALSRLAAQTKLSPSEFAKQFGGLFEAVPA
ncbi:MAG: diphosphate--fructose-6-phosphate 1-phosphotransferase [Candidatus Baltobacteraceae bacterium]